MIFLLISTLTALRMDAQSSLKDSSISDSAYAVALRQYHAYVAPEVGLYRGIQYIDYDFTVQKGQPFLGPGCHARRICMVRRNQGITMFDLQL